MIHLNLEEFGSYEDFTAFYIKIDNADPMLLYLEQTPAKYLHLSCIFPPCHDSSAHGVFDWSEFFDLLLLYSSQTHPHFI